MLHKYWLECASWLAGKYLTGNPNDSFHGVLARRISFHIFCKLICPTHKWSPQEASFLLFRDFHEEKLQLMWSKAATHATAASQPWWTGWGCGAWALLALGHVAVAQDHAVPKSLLSHVKQPDPSTRMPAFCIRAMLAKGYMNLLVRHWPSANQPYTEVPTGSFFSKIFLFSPLFSLFKIKICVLMKCCVDFWIHGSLKRCPWAQGCWGWGQSQGSLWQQRPLKLTLLLLLLLSSFTQHANTGLALWVSYINYVSIKYWAKSVSNTLFVSSVRDCFLHWPLGFRSVKLSAVGIVFAAPERKLVKQNVSNRIWSFTASQSKCVRNTLSGFDALPLNFYAKPCGIHRCSKAFTCYFVLQDIIYYKLINRWTAIWQMEEIITIFRFWVYVENWGSWKERTVFSKCLSKMGACVLEFTNIQMVMDSVCFS